MSIIQSIMIICSLIHLTRADDSIDLRSKRHAFYYLCGSPPNQYYSTRPCSPLPPPRCENGGRLIGVGCQTSVDCTPFHSGVSQCIKGCCCTSTPSPPLPPTPIDPSRFGVCYHGQLSEVRCNDRRECENGQSCMNGLCCTITGDEYQHACGGEAALGSCSRVGTCPSGEFCSSSNYCCECPVGTSPGRCTINGGCPAGYSCQSNGYCCAACPGNVMPFGACRHGRCGGGRTCRAGNICC